MNQFMLPTDLEILNATQDDIDSVIEKYPGTKEMICQGENDINLVIKDETDNVIAILSAFFREIPAPLDGSNECFILLIDIFDTSLHRKGIGSALLQKAIKEAKTHDIIQIRSYCDIGNISSHRLWLKNGFGISPVKNMDGSILGSFVTLRV